jgi:hypothetical protein
MALSPPQPSAKPWIAGQERYRVDVVEATFLMIHFERQGLNSDARYYREIRDQRLTEIASLLPPKEP